MIEPVFGENVIDYPSFYIGEKGDFYISIRNYSSSEPVILRMPGSQLRSRGLMEALIMMGLTHDCGKKMEQRTNAGSKIGLISIGFILGLGLSILLGMLLLVRRSQASIFNQRPPHQQQQSHPLTLPPLKCRHLR